jgi:release factor glutamine methyltransferase
MHVLECDRVRLYLDFDSPVDAKSASKFQHLIGRRVAGEPSAYITGHREFYGLDFRVNRRVLVPRPETELVVEEALRIARVSDIKTIADIGSGSGAVSVTLARLLPRVTVFAIDISEDALETCRQNSIRHGVANRVKLVKGDLLLPLTRPVDLIVANLPYVRAADIPSSGPLSFEPRLALDGGPDGLDVIRRLVDQLKHAEFNHVIMEIGQGQREAVIALLEAALPAAHITSFVDLGGIERVIILSVTGVSEQDPSKPVPLICLS